MEQATAADAGLSANLAKLRRAESVVQALAAEGAFDHVALYAEVAAHRAAHAHAGEFSSRVLEAALFDAASSLGGTERPSAAATGALDGSRVLHVATEIAFPEGGHGRSLVRWVEADPARRHSLALTSPRADAPSVVHTAIEASGGAIYRLAPGSSSFLRRASELRRLALDADFVVLHHHPWDAVVTIALAFPGRPPTVSNNHAGHLFWLGRTVSDVVTYGRDAAREICVRRRGICSEACRYLPVPPSTIPPGGGQRLAARSTLRAEPEDLVLLTVASGFKLQALDGDDFVGMVTAAVEKRPRLAWRIAGPPAAGPWAELAARTGGRVRALGAGEDAALLYAGADVYLDSYPFTSQTALLDAAAAALPLLAPRWHSPAASILGAWGGVADSAIAGFDDEQSLGALIDSLAEDRRREAWGEAAAEAAKAGSEAWKESLGQVYISAVERSRARTRGGLAPTTDVAEVAGDLDRYLVGLYSLPDSSRVLINWHRDLTNFGATVAFPGDEAWLAQRAGLAGLVGELELILRDFEAYARHLETRHEAEPTPVNAAAMRP